MEYVDQDGNEVDINKVLTIIVPISIIGDQGTERFFWMMRQYIFDSIEDHDAYFYQCEPISTLRNQPCYKIIEDSEEIFYLPVTFGVVEGRGRSRDEQDFKKLYEKKADQPRDMVKAYKEATGIDLDKTHNVKHNGIRVQRKAEKEEIKKYPKLGDREEDPPEQQTY